MQQHDHKHAAALSIPKTLHLLTPGSRSSFGLLLQAVNQLADPASRVKEIDGTLLAQRASSPALDSADTKQQILPAHQSDR